MDIKKVGTPLFKGYENEEQSVVCLWLDYRLRIELLENIHIHFGDDGEHRVEITPREFLEIAEAFEGVDG